MNYLVILDPSAGELEKILSGIKSMLVKELCPAQPAVFSVNPGDSLYFLRSKEDTTLRVKATVIHVMCFTSNLTEDFTHTLKEMQPRLQFTEEQYNYWAAKKQMILVEFGSAQKINPVQLAEGKIPDQSNWIAFNDHSLLWGSA